MIVASLTIGLISGFTLLRYCISRSRSEIVGFSRASAVPPTEADLSYDTPLEAAIAGAEFGQVVWVSGTPLVHTRVHNIRPGSTVEETLTIIKVLTKLSPTTVVVNGLAGLEPPGSAEAPNAVVDELLANSPSPVHIFLPAVGVAR
jgi:hypothetical protein